MPILMLINLKGGVAKTTNAVAIAECLAASGHRTLVIDADHQCMAGELLLGESRLSECERCGNTLYDLLAAMLDDQFDAEQITPHIAHAGSNIGGGMKNLSVIPCSVRIEDFSTNMAKAKRGWLLNEEFQRMLDRRRQQVRRWLLENADFTIIDCPPSLSLQVRFLLRVADGFIIPSVPDNLSVRGSICLLSRLDKAGFKKIKPVGTLWSLYRQQNHVHRAVVEKSSRRIEPYSRLPLPFETLIPNATAIAATADVRKMPASFKEKYTQEFAKLYERLCEEIVSRTECAGADATATALLEMAAV